MIKVYQVKADLHEGAHGIPATINLTGPMRSKAQAEKALAAAIEGFSGPNVALVYLHVEDIR